MQISFKFLKDLLRPFYYWFYLRYIRTLEILFPSKITDPKTIPIIINNYNRLTYLKALIESLEKRGYFNIYIIDNASTYPPLLEFYKKCKYKIFFLSKNSGHLALWKTKISKIFINDFYVYTDSDVLPVDACPDDFMKVFQDTLKKYRFARKVGFSLKIDNIPGCYKLKNDVILWEKQYFENEIDGLLYRAPIDTTFALYRPWAKGGSNSYIPMYRTKFPYEAEHLPWYIDSDNLSDEERFYILHSRTSTMWTQEYQKSSK